MLSFPGLKSTCVLAVLPQNMRIPLVVFVYFCLLNTEGDFSAAHICAQGLCHPLNTG